MQRCTKKTCKRLHETRPSLIDLCFRRVYTLLESCPSFNSRWRRIRIDSPFVGPTTLGEGQVQVLNVILISDQSYGLGKDTEMMILWGMSTRMRTRRKVRGGNDLVSGFLPKVADLFETKENSAHSFPSGRYLKESCS